MILCGNKTNIHEAKMDKGNENVNNHKRSLSDIGNNTVKKRRKKNNSNTIVNNVSHNKNDQVLNEKPEERFIGTNNVDEEDSGNEEDTNNDMKHLSGTYMVQHLNSTNGLDILRTFIKVCNDSNGRDLAAEYLNAGGSVLEILKLLNITDKKGIGAAKIVFSALRILIIKTLAEYPQYQYIAHAACRLLLSSHLSIVHSMLSMQSDVKQRRIILQLLAAAVSLGGNLPCELLTHLSLPSDIVKSLVQHTKPMDNQNIRNCYIHFILAFLIDGNISNIRALLDKRDLLFSIFHDLIYDSKDIVVLILTTLQTYIIKNPNISKTIKLQIFSISVTQNIVQLYNWKGPRYWEKCKGQDMFANAHYIEEKESLIEIVHDFLILLLTSHRHGIIFHDHSLGTSSRKHNHVVNTILQSLDRPWEHEKPRDLVLKIMATCPDLIRSQYLHLEPYVDPRVSLKWITAMKFVKDIINSLDAESCIKMSSSKLNTIQLTNAVMSLIVPIGLVKRAILPSLAHSSIFIRHEAIITLTSLLNQIQKYLSSLKACKNDNEFRLSENIVTEFIIKHVPHLSTILKVWSNTFISDTIDDTKTYREVDIQEPKKYEHLIAILDLLYMYNKICPKFLDICHDLHPDTFLEMLNKLNDTPINIFNSIKAKVIQFLVTLHTNAFQPHKEIFMDALSFLISILTDEMSSVTISANFTMKALLNASGIFEGCSDHLDIWINGFVGIKKRKRLTKWFIQNMQETVKNVERYVNEVIEMEETSKQDIVHIGKMKSIFDELVKRKNIRESLENNISQMQRLTSVSPLLCCMLHTIRQDTHSSILSYLSYVLIHTLHWQVSPECLIRLCENVKKLPGKEYLLSWLECNQSVNAEHISSSMSLVCNLSSVFLSDAKLQINELFDGNSVVDVSYNNEIITIHYTLSAFEIVHLYKMSTFYFAQFIKRGTLTNIQYDNYKIFLISLLHMAMSSSDNNTLVEECAKCYFKHPIILHYFSPLYEKGNDLIRSMLTSMTVDICKTIVYLWRSVNLRSLFSHFKNKFVMQICKMIDEKQKCEKVQNIDNVISLLELLQPSAQDIICLLKKILKLENSMFVSMEEKNLSFYGFAVPKLLSVITNNYFKAEQAILLELDAEFVSQLCMHLLFIKSKSIKNFELWEMVLHGYLSKFVHNIAGIDTNIFTSFLSSRLTDTAVQLITLLISKNIKFKIALTTYLMESDNLKRENIVLPIIGSNLQFKWNQQLLESLVKCYQTDVFLYICDPKEVKPWIEKHAVVISYLIEKAVDLKVCIDASQAVLHVGDELDAVSVHYVKLVESVYSKCIEADINGKKYITNLIQILLHITTLTLKRESKNYKKLDYLSKALIDAVKRLREKDQDFKFEILHTCNSWSQFTRFALKFSLKQSKNEEQESVRMLKALSTLCNIAYMDNSNHEYVKTLFEMTTSHSEFVNFMLGASSTKRDLVELLLVLIQKNTTVMAVTHIPLYLAAYNATLNEVDQYILSILQCYENNNMNIYEYRPYIWGNAAAIHYSVKGENCTTLWRQPSVAQVVNLFEENMINNTITNYPVDRPLKSNELYRANDTYDPAFYLPLLCFLLSENNIVPCNKVARSGALALAFIACSSTHSDVRMVAYTIIAKYYAHLEASNIKAKIISMRLVNAFRYGIISSETELNNLRINHFVSTFLARTSLIATQPLHPLYSVLQVFLMAKPALDINSIPEFLQLFHSSDVEHKVHRCYILENIRDGMKTEYEVDVAFKCVLFKILFDFYTCVLADKRTKKLILEIVDVTLTINKGSVLLIESYGLFPWLMEVTKNACKEGAQHVDLIVKIMEKLLNTVLHMKRHVVHYKSMLLNIVLSLRSHLLQDIMLTTFTTYINILQKLIIRKDVKSMMVREHIVDILQFSKKLLDNVEDCEDILRFGCEFVIKSNCVNDNDEIEVAKNSLRTLICTWCVRGEKIQNCID